MATVSDEPFQYPPLEPHEDAFRLLKVLPANPNHDAGADVISCQLEPVRLGASYFALSYSWGPPDSRHRLKLNGALIMIRTNLLNFLRVASRSPVLINTYLWIDALCINQEDVNERNRQVSLMGDIYYHAEAVVVWLGNVGIEVHHFEPFFAQTTSTTDLYRAALEAWQVSTKSESVYQQARRYAHCLDVWRACDTDVQLAVLKSVSKICKVEYWGRAWIVQELFLASKLVVLCDDGYAVPWIWLSVFVSDNYVTGVWRILGGRDAKDEVYESLAPTVIRDPNFRWNLRHEVFLTRPEIETLKYHTMESTDTGSKFQLLLDKFQQWNCTDIRDKIYAFRGLATSGNQMKVDYSASLPTIFMAALSFCLREGLPDYTDALTVAWLILRSLNIDLAALEQEVIVTLAPTNVDLFLDRLGELTTSTDRYGSSWNAKWFKMLSNNAAYSLRSPIGGITTSIGRVQICECSDCSHDLHLEPDDQVWVLRNTNLGLIFRQTDRAKNTSSHFVASCNFLGEIREEPVTCFKMGSGFPLASSVTPVPQYPADGEDIVELALTFELDQLISLLEQTEFVTYNDTLQYWKWKHHSAEGEIFKIVTES